MKIALVIDAWEPIVGGGQKNVLEISSRIVKQGHRINIFTRKLPGYTQNEIKNHIHIFRCGPTTDFFNPIGRIFSIFSILIRLIKENHKDHYDLVHCHTFLGAIPAKIFSMLTGLPIIITVHGTNLTDTKAKGLSAWLERKICFDWKYDQVIAVGQGYLNHPHSSPVTIIPNGVNMAKYDLTPSHKKNNGKTNFLFVGRFEWTKGIEYLLSSVKTIKKKYPDIYHKISINLVGYGYNQKKYQDYVDKNNLSEVIKFLGKKTNNNLIKEYKSNDIFILPSLTEGDPLVIKEAWAASLPVIGTKCNSSEYVVNNNKDGWIIKKQSSTEITKIIVKICSVPKNILDEMGKNGYQKVAKCYQWDKIAKSTLSIYKKTISASTKPPIYQ